MGRDVSQNLDLRQSQGLVMTPQLRQAIRLLQLNNVELAEFVEAEIEKNPFLKKASSEDSEGERSENEQAGVKDILRSGGSGSNSGNSNIYAGRNSGGGASGFDSPDNVLENSITRPKTLREHLVEQLNLAFSDPRDRIVGTLIIDAIDESGYLREDSGTLAEKLDCSEERVSRLLEKMRGFHPSGIFARDLKDCLSLQLEEQGKLDDPMKILLDNLELLADRDHAELARKCLVNETYLKDMIADIKALDPKPASGFDHVVVQSVIPDVIMRKLPRNLGGGWGVELNSDTLPRVLIDREYRSVVANSSVTSKKDRECITGYMNSANWLVKAMDQRAKTILKIAGEIVEQQNAFFNYGVEFLRPLSLKDVAEETGVHESTVSRVTNNKYIETPRGVFELKYFFSTALVGAGGQSHSSESIKERIRNMIDAEEPDRILSDDRIVQILKREGIDIARRTVAKYRDAMHIPSSVRRRKQKKAML